MRWERSSGLKKTQEGYEPVTLVEGLGRVADVAVADFTGDDQLDLLVAEFGHRRTGGIHLLTNNGDKELSFHSILLDVRPGTVQVQAHDWKMAMGNSILRPWSARSLNA